MAQASPTKRFFVSMLTRDISLDDAVLDLLDNCIDGVLRASANETVDYSDYAVSIEMSEQHFRIIDNCGGIPREIAKNYAFKLGREPDDRRDEDTETIGMYGIGMKRAIFKIGRESRVTTSHKGDAYEVLITPDWLDAKGWDPLPIIDLDVAETIVKNGTSITVTNLDHGVARHFSNSSFVDSLKKAVAEHFSTFLQKGLTVTLNGENVTPVLVEVLASEDPADPAPYIYRKEIEGVVVSIVVGLNTGRRFDEDEDAVDFVRDRSSVTAGCTVFCNDRAVVVGDKTRLTGWGDGIPTYHDQYSVITGIIEFRSSSADKLPITTTKRALDASSHIWLEARVKLKEALRVWISYTNDWKNRPREDQAQYWTSAKPATLKSAFEIVESRSGSNRAGNVVEYNPKKKKVLPVPSGKQPSSRRITFTRPSEEIRAVSSLLFDREDETPGIVGEKCFAVLLEKSELATGDEE
jgi:hypothetical protein